MDARVGVPLGILGAAFVLPFVFLPAMLFAWSLTFAGLYLLSREPAWRRAARIALASLAAFLVVGLIGAGLVLGWRGRAVARTPIMPGEEWLGTVLIVCGIMATGVLLMFAPAPTSRRLARWASASAALLVVVIALVEAGERISGLIGLFGVVTFALVGAALLAAFGAAKSPAA